MATIVLVPGAGLGAWVWSRVTPLLEAEGHDVHAVTLTGLGEDDRDADVSQVGLSTHVADVVVLLEREQLTDVVLVGHSYAGAVVTGVAEAAPQRIAQLVYLDGEIPQSEVSAFAAGGAEFEGAIVAAAEAGGDATRVPWFDDETLDTYFPGNEISAEDRAWIAENAAGHPIGTFGEGLTLGGEEAAALPRTYVTSLRRMMPSPISDETPDWDHVTLDTGHFPQVTLPDRTAEVLHAIARGELGA